MAVPKGTRVGGRKKGTPNKATADVKEAAQKYGPAALKKLAALMQSAESEQAQIAAAKEILDRAYGRASQAISGDLTLTHKVSDELKDLIAAHDGKTRGIPQRIR